MPLLFLMMWFLAQSGSNETSGGVPLPLLGLIVLVVAGLFIRVVFKTGSQHHRFDDFDDDDDDDDRGYARRGGGRQHDDDEEELYLIDRDHAWDEDGYSIDDEF